MDRPRFWDKTTGEMLQVISGYNSPVTKAVFSPDGTHILTTHMDGKIHNWEVAPILLSSPQDQVRMACQALYKANAPLSFTRGDAQRYPVIQAEPIHPETGHFVSPCHGVLPDEAFQEGSP